MMGGYLHAKNEEMKRMPEIGSPIIYDLACRMQI
jgi:hypothetical protein